jgi:hypothetical protein
MLTGKKFSPGTCFPQVQSKQSMYEDHMQQEHSYPRLAIVPLVSFSHLQLHFSISHPPHLRTATENSGSDHQPHSSASASQQLVHTSASPKLRLSAGGGSWADVCPDSRVRHAPRTASNLLLPCVRSSPTAARARLNPCHMRDHMAPSSEGMRKFVRAAACWRASGGKR